ncbi:MAG TPA: hypothetical protein VEG30_13750 [Terriglobales bacterium]|nr:hypothetical protein [Terriglobales bacterium]
MRSSVLIGMFLVAVCCAVAQSAPPASWKCDPKTRLRPDDPVYTEALQLSQILSKGGLQVKCVLRSKTAQPSAWKKGAALYRTERGDFEALFAVKPEDFANLTVVEQPQQDGLHVYEYRGLPGKAIDRSSHREYFVKHRGTFVITYDRQLAQSLSAIFETQQQL